MFKRRSSQALLLTVMLALVLIIASGCGGQKEAADPAANYPEKPIEFLCGWAPGGGSDQVARAFAPLVEKELGQPVTVVNKEGGSGATSYAELAKSNPDG
jgi:tripartite-type tricarboxylate transporter receptor subunit TctC